MERGILKICMDNKKNIAEIGRLKPDDFYSQTHQLIYESMLEMFEAGEVIDHATIQDYMHRTGRLQNLSVEYINNTWIFPATKSSLQHYVDVVIELSIRRQMYWYFEDIKNRVLDTNEDVNIILSQISARLMDFHVNTEGDGVYTFGDSYTDILSADPMGLKMGFTDLDKMTMGLGKGELIVLAGRPAMGKTALALNITANICKAGKSCLFMSLEMTEQELKKRLVHSELGVSKRELMQKTHEDEEKARIQSLVGKSTTTRINEWGDYLAKVKSMDDGWKLKIVDTSINNLLDLRNEATKIKAKCGLDLIVVDYLQLMSVSGYKDNRVGEISHITRQLKLLAKEFNVPLLVLSQLSRAAESGSESRPKLSHLRESGSIEQDADKVLLMYRQKYYDKNISDETTEVIVAKNRHGMSGTVYLDFEPQYTRFKDIPIAGEKANRSENAQVKGAFE